MFSFSDPAPHHDRTDGVCTGVKTAQIRHLPWRWAAAAVLLAAAGCASVPGETLAPRSVRRDVSSKVLDQASQGKPDCKRVKIVDTEVLEVHGDGKVAAERWMVDRCDERIGFRVAYPAKSGPVSVKREP